MVWQRNRYCQYSYPAFIPYNPRTPAQVAVRGTFGAVSKRWRELKEDQRLIWCAVARTRKSKPRLCQCGPLTGFLLFVKVNVPLANRGIAQVDLPPGYASYALTCLEKCLLPLQEKIFLRLAPARWFSQANGDSFPVLEHLLEGKPRAYRLDHLAKGKGKFPPAARVPRLPARCIPRGKVRAPGPEPCRSTTPQTACRRAMLWRSPGPAWAGDRVGLSA